MMQVMFGACLRVSETIGLTWSDVDMKNREIHVGGQLVYYEDEGILDEMEQWVEDFLNAVPANKREYFSRLIRENTEY